MPVLTSTAYAATAQFRGNIGTMIVDADPVVKLVMLVLMIFSIFSWGIIIQKWVMLARARKRAHPILETAAKVGSLARLREVVEKAGECPVASMFEEGLDEVSRLSGKSGMLSQAMLVNIEARLGNAHARQTMDLSHGLGFLASISNASPFIGLFGTVWGIMDSFRHIALMGSANLATVAPGISEALIATAAGLFVAIPAVLFFNYFTSLVTVASGQMEQFQVDFVNSLRRGMLHADK
ncbi:MAG TPA: MotA/TolQ/ExbB proton channel family protein [Deltaproteobacteria bacterium]|nr:MotA/TolQ/ExbB proton channel family protein [Deltaproteobacteria bacterium]HPR56364.1 MotA/TolQ/ExbB proton channel family protein [Deltaproteobacteria bacterium]HXK48702.1 MotA/TolQ/ExbB proton channel family protein [Deltaproteobacteria bacterium]